MRLIKKIINKCKMNYIHFTALTSRYLKIIFSDKITFISLLIQAPLMVVILYITCGDKDYTSEKFNQGNLTFSLFIIVCISIFMGILNSYREVSKEREIMLREYSGGMDCIAYVLSKVFVQAIISFVQSIIIVAGSLIFLNVLPISGEGVHTTYRIIMYFVILFLTFLAANSIALFVSCLFKSSDQAILPVLFLIIAQLVLSNALVNLPSNMKFLSYFTIEKWALSGLASLFNLSSIQPFKTPYSMDGYNSSLLLSLVMLIIFVIVPTIFSILIISRANRVKKIK